MKRDTNTIGLLVIGAAVFTLAVLAVANSHHGLRTIDHWLDRYQSLLTGLGAIGAAVWAVRPVRAQLEEISKQSAVQTRAVLVERERSASVRLEVCKTLVNFSFFSPPYDDKEDEYEHSPEAEQRDWEDIQRWAASQSERLSNAAFQLDQQTEEKSDSEVVDKARRKLSKALSKASNMLSTVGLPSHTDLWEDINEEERQGAEASSREKWAEYLTYKEELRAHLKSFRNVYATQVQQLRDAVRAADRVIFPTL